MDFLRCPAVTVCARSAITLAGLAAALFAPADLRAQGLYELHEVPLLPEYCKYSQDFRERVPGGNNPAQIERWHSRLGDTFIHIHHYCYGLVALSRATSATRTAQQRAFQLNRAAGEFSYVIDRAPTSFVLLPEILWRRGDALIRLGKAPNGILELERAIDLKQDYWPPYATISDHYKEAGDLPKAREWLEKGLSAAPNTKALLRRLAELDGSKAARKPAPPSAGTRPAAPSPE